MSESVQAVTALVLIVGLIGTVIAWMIDDASLPVRLGFPAAAVGSFALLLWSFRRRDKAPDFLSRVSRRFFERDGFCFAVIPEVEHGRCYLALYYHSRYERPFQGRVILQPAKGFFLTRPDLATVVLSVEGPAGGFGMTRLPLAVPDPFQGKTMRFDLAADVSYPEGRGKMIRYRGGSQVRGAKLEWWRAATTVAGAFTGTVVLWKPAQFKLTLPSGVFETVPEDEPVVSSTLWRPGDSPDGVFAPA